MAIFVQDSGIGIKDEDKFFRLFGAHKNEEQNLNTGGIFLGLLISKLILAKFNGYIDFILKHNKGSSIWHTTRFTF